MASTTLGSRVGQEQLHGVTCLQSPHRMHSSTSSTEISPRRCVRPSIAHLEGSDTFGRYQSGIPTHRYGAEAPATAYPSRNCRYVHQAKSILGAICTELTNSYTGTQACSRYTAQPRSRAHSWDAQGEGCYPSAHIIGMVKGLKSILPRNRYRKGRIMESRVQR